MALICILLGCAVILYGIECLCGMPGLTRWGMVVVLVLLAVVIDPWPWVSLIGLLCLPFRRRHSCPK